MAGGMKYLVAVLVAMATVTSGQDTSVCKQVSPGPNDPKRPVLENTFELHAEANIDNRGYTADVHMWFDMPNNRAAAHFDKNGTKTDMVYSFNTDEIFVIDWTNTPGTAQCGFKHHDKNGTKTDMVYSFNTDEIFVIDRTSNPAKCQVQKLSNSFYLFLFGYKTPTGSHIYNTSSAFHFGDARPEKWMGQTQIRGVQVNQWRSCLFWNQLNSTMQVDWYWSIPTWKTSTENIAVPVRAVVSGKTSNNTVVRAFNHTYEFMDYHQDLSHLTAFETPTGVYCPKRKQTKPLPNPASAFHFTSEIVYPDFQQIAYIKEYYDYDLGLVRYDRTPVQTTAYGMNPQTTIHDFNTGVAYHIDDVRGNCTPTAIQSDRFDVRSSDPTHVRIRTSKEFYYFDKTNYTYEGTRAVRGMLADVWIAQRTDWPTPTAGVNSTWEWYFLSHAYTANIPDQLQFGMPIRMTLNAGAFQSAIYNIYDYDERRPDIWSFDISSCFNYTQKRDFSFLLPASFRMVANSNTENFKYAVIKGITKAGSSGSTILSALRIINIRFRMVASSNLERFKYSVLIQIQGVGGVSALRVNNIQVDYADNNDIIVKFTLLDKAPPIGDVKTPQQEQGLNTVATSISNAINAGNLVVKMMANGNPVIMKAKAYSLTPTQNVVQRSYYVKPSKVVTTGTSGGVMAGMAVALLVVFFATGVVATYMFYRRRGGAFLPKKFDNTDITQDTS